MAVATAILGGLFLPESAFIPRSLIVATPALTIKPVARLRDWNLGSAIKLLLLFLVYPFFTWFILNVAAASDSLNSAPNPLQALLFPVMIGTYAVAGVGLLFVIAVPLWSFRSRKRPEILHIAFRRGLYASSILLAIIVPIQGILLALAILVSSLEIWFWGLLAAGGAIFATVVLLHNGLRNEPGVYLTLRASRINLADHPKLQAELEELTQELRVSLPRHILVGLQPETLGTTATVFCSDGELNGGLLCLSLPTSQILSIAEFRALVGETLVRVQESLHDNRTEFVSITEGVNDVVRNLNDTMKDYSWWPRIVHPYFILFWWAIVAAMRFPLYVGKAWLTFYVKSAWSSREALDAQSWLSAYSKSAQDVGTIAAVTALIKEASISLIFTLLQMKGQEASHPLVEIARFVSQQHPGLTLDVHRWNWKDLPSAWQYLQFRCKVAGKNLDWCVQLACDVTPAQPAASLFENTSALNARVLDLLKEPFVVAKRQAVSST